MHKVELQGLLLGRPVEAAEAWMQFAPEQPGPLEILSPPPGLNYYISLVHKLQGGHLIAWAEVEDQKALNALAGYFTVVPRRLPEPECLCDLCDKPVTDGSKDVVSGRPRHRECIPW